MDCIFNKWLKCCEGAKTVWGNGEWSLALRGKRKIFASTQQYSEVFAYIIYNII